MHNPHKQPKNVVHKTQNLDKFQANPCKTQHQNTHAQPNHKSNSKLTLYQTNNNRQKASPRPIQITLSIAPKTPTQKIYQPKPKPKQKTNTPKTQTQPNPEIQ